MTLDQMLRRTLMHMIQSTVFPLNPGANDHFGNYKKVTCIRWEI
jgi:hypothetical protein